MSYYSPLWLRYFIRWCGPFMIKQFPFEECYFLEDAKKFRAALKGPLIYVGGLVSREGHRPGAGLGIRAGSDGPGARQRPGVRRKKLREGDAATRSVCDHRNYCIARMYSVDMKCCKHCDNLPATDRRRTSNACRDETRSNHTVRGAHRSRFRKRPASAGGEPSPREAPGRWSRSRVGHRTLLRPAAGGAGLQPGAGGQPPRTAGDGMQRNTRRRAGSGRRRPESGIPRRRVPGPRCGSWRSTWRASKPLRSCGRPCGAKEPPSTYW